MKEKIQSRFIFWALVSVTGAIGLSFPDLFQAFSHGTFNRGILTGESLKGVMFACAAVFCWGSATVIGKKLSLAGYKPRQIMGMRFIYGFLGLLIANFLLVDMMGVFKQTQSYSAFLSSSSALIWQKLLLMVSLSGLLAMGFYYAGLRRISARSCSIMELFFPLCAIAVNWVYLGKQLDISQIVGGALLILGATVVQTKHY